MVLVVLAGGASACVGGSDGLVKWTSKLYALIGKASGGSSSDAIDDNTTQGQNVTHLLLHCSGRFLGRNFCASSYR